jgi:hypothetical protein
MRREIILLALLGISSPALSSTLLECSKIIDPAERVACYDGLAGRVEKKMEEAKESHVGTTEERIQTLNEGIADEVLGEDTPEPEILSLKIKEIVMDKRTGRIIFLAEDGREFARSASSMRKFDVADEVSIERGMLGSMFLVRQDGLRIKVKELD